MDEIEKLPHESDDNNLPTNETAAKIGKSEPLAEDVDVESALAAIGSLQDLMRPEPAPREAIPEEDRRYLPPAALHELAAVDDSAQASERFSETSPQSDFPTPPLSRLQRGTLPSIVPAVFLMGLGGMLTFLLTSATISLNLPLLMLIAIGSLGLILLAQGLVGRRWSVGTFFIGASLFFLAVTGIYLLQGNLLTIQTGYPLVLTALGLAFLLSEIVSAQQERVWWLGLLLGVAGIGGVVVTGGFLDSTVLTRLQSLLPVAAVIVVVLLFAPFLRRRRS